MPTRRTILKAAVLAPLAAPFAHGAHAAGKLAIAVRQHRMPGAGAALAQICNEWAAREKIDLTFDLVGTAGGRDRLTLSDEARVASGHDIVGLDGWSVATWQDRLVPLDDLVAPAIAAHGAVSPGCAYLGRIDGHWRAMPSGYDSVALPACARIDHLNLYAGIAVEGMYPGPGGTPDAALQDGWTWDGFLTAAAGCAAAGHFFALGLSACNDAVDWVGAMFAAQGVRLADADGHAAVRSEATRQVLEWFQKLAGTLPGAVYAYDDEANGKALIAGKAALIFNSPDAYAAAVRSAPQVASLLWTFPPPKGPQGRFVPARYGFWGLWNFSTRIAAAKALLAHLATTEVQDKLVAASTGSALPAFAGWHDFSFWREAGPPAGTLFNYPPRGDAVPHVAGYPAPPKIAAQLYSQATATRMIALCTRGGKSIDDAIAWAEKEIDEFTRS